MKQLMLLILVLLAVGCATPPPPVNSPPFQEPKLEAPVIASILVMGSGGEQRFTPAGGNDALELAGPVRLRVDAALEPKGHVEWFFEGLLNQSPGLVPSDARRMVRVGEGSEVEWSPGPGTQGRLWVEVWGEASRAGRSGWRSWDLYPRYPLVETTQCPPVRLRRLESYGEAGPGQTVSDSSMNAVFIHWMGEEYLIPRSVDPKTCEDPFVAARLR